MADKWAAWRAKTPKTYQGKSQQELAKDFERGFKPEGNAYAELLKKNKAKLAERRTEEESPSKFQ